MSVSSIGEATSELLKLAKASIETYGSAVKAEKGNPPASADEVTRLQNIAKESRAAFDRRLNEVVGSDRQHSKDWNFAVQKAYVLGMVGDNVFRYVHGDGVLARDLMNKGRAYVEGHKALGWTVEHGVNPRSVQNLERALVAAEKVAVDSLDVNRLQPIRAALSGLRRHCENLLKVEARPAPQPTQTNTSLGAELARAQEAVAETPQPTAAPRPRNARRER